MAMIQTFFVGILLFFQSIFAPMIYDIPTGSVDYGGGFDYKTVEAAEIEKPLDIFIDGETDYVIVIPDGVTAETEPVLRGVKWLQEYFGLMLDEDEPFEVYAASALPTGAKYISVGRTGLGGSDFADELDALKSSEDLIKKVIGDNIYISGKDNGRGSMYGCSAFVEDQLGCRWYTYELKYAPKTKDIFIDGDLDDTQEAKFDYRDNYWPYIYLYPEFKAFHKSNSTLGDRWYNGELYTINNYGGAVEYFAVGWGEPYNHHIGGFCHTMHNLVPRQLFYGDYDSPALGHRTQDQELFAYRKDTGRRDVGQRCLTNPDVLEMTKEAVFYIIDTNINNMNMKIISITQEDNDAYCQCVNCEAMDNLYGGRQSGSNLWFTNEIAKAVAERYESTRPDILVDTFAYAYSVAPPTGIVPEENVIVRLCTIGCCFNHPIRECGGQRTGSVFADMKPKASVYAKYFEDWGKLCDVNGAQLHVWDYNTCFKFYPAIYPNVHVLADNLQFFYENNARGVFSEGYDTGGVELLPGSVSGEFGELRVYMLAKLLWDPYLNSNQLMEEFMHAYYGEAATPYILQFLDFYTNKAIGTNHTGVFGRPEAFTYMNVFECKKMEKLFDKAEAVAAGNADNLLAVKRTRLCLKLYEANMMLGDYSWFNPMRLKNNKELFHESVMLGLDRFSAAMIEPYDTYVWLHRPYDWANMKSWIDFYDADKAVRMDLEAYRAEHGYVIP
ncbi:MAG: DUF4838 domain-containing protein [Oscillospiraceae bacterium]|nr:DUF4838 domain-containing protein [Oscillospiraceae bacterium]